MQEIYSLFKKLDGVVVTAMVHAKNKDRFLADGFFESHKDAESDKPAVKAKKHEGK
jgi:hypothetical protein